MSYAVCVRLPLLHVLLSLSFPLRSHHVPSSVYLQPWKHSKFRIQCFRKDGRTTPPSLRNRPKMFFITFVHVLTHRNQSVTRCWVVKLYFKILPSLLLLAESHGGKFQHRDAGQLLCRAPSTSCATAVQPHCGANEMNTKTPSNQPSTTVGSPINSGESVISNSCVQWTLNRIQKLFGDFYIITWSMVLNQWFPTPINRCRCLVSKILQKFHLQNCNNP